jgi:flavin reductase (DIM6/NTAB) family NADH-FMN oxidoreductase RutF
MVQNSVERVLEMFPYGLFVVGSMSQTSPVAIIANWATQVSFRPPLVMLAIEENSRMRTAIEESGIFSMSLLGAGETETAKKYARSPSQQSKEEPKLAISESGMPFAEEAAGWIGCRVVQTVSTGDHLTVVGEVLEAGGASDTDVLTLKETGWRYRG